MNQSYRVVSATHSQLWRSCHWSCGGSHPARPPVPRWEGEHVLHRQPPIDTPRHPLRGNRTTRLTQPHCVEGESGILITYRLLYFRPVEDVFAEVSLMQDGSVQKKSISTIWLSTDSHFCRQDLDKVTKTRLLSRGTASSYKWCAYKVNNV